MAHTEYSPRQLTAIARAAVKGKGTYRRWKLVLQSGAFQPLIGVALLAFRLLEKPSTTPAS